MTEILTTAGIRYVNIRGDITVTESGEDVVIDSGALDSTIDFDSYNLLVIGHDATAYVEFDQLIAAVDEIDTFVDDGGSIFIGQLNDKSVVDTPMPFLNGDRTFILHTEKDPANDFTDGEVVAGSAGHPLLTGGVIFEGWEFIESGQQQVKTADL